MTQGIGYPRASSDGPLGNPKGMIRQTRCRNGAKATRNMKTRQYDLASRLLEFSLHVVRIVEQLPNTRTGNHVAGQLLRAGTSPCSNHAEAQSAESPKDFVHKMRVALKELRETLRWLRLIQQVPLISPSEQLNHLLQENDELIRIFVVSIRTAEKNQAGPQSTSK